MLRDPFHRIDVLPSSRRVKVTLGDDVIVDTDRAVLLFETGLPQVAYVPRADVRAAIERAERETYCPYKGEARYWTVAGVEQAAWSYEYPRPESHGHRRLRGVRRDEGERHARLAAAARKAAFWARLPAW